MKRKAPEGYLTSNDVAVRLGLDENTVRSYRVEGKGPPFIKDRTTGRVLYNKSEVEAWEKSQGISDIVKARLRSKTNA